MASKLLCGREGDFRKRTRKHQVLGKPKVLTKA